MLEWWRAQLAEALPLEYVLPLLIILSGLWFGADYFYSVYKSSAAAELIHEVAEDVKTHSVVSWEDVRDEPMKVSEVIHMVGQEPARVLRL